MTCVEEYKNADHSLVIYHDEFIGNPRTENCNLFCLGLYGKYSFYNEDLPESEYEDFLKSLKGNSEFLAFPVYCYEHSGVAFNTTGFSCPWDSGMIGFIYTNQWNVYQDHNVRMISPKLKERLRAIAEAELQELEDYVMGRGYGYYLYDKDDNEIDQCSGFLGDDHEENGLFESVLMNTDIEFKPEHLA